jgi:hypothetical protein
VLEQPFSRAGKPRHVLFHQHLGGRERFHHAFRARMPSASSAESQQLKPSTLRRPTASRHSSSSASRLA